MRAVNGAILRQYGATFKMLRRSVERCPDQLWGYAVFGAPVWRHAYHALWYLDRYFSGAFEECFTPPAFHIEGAEQLAEPHPEALSVETVLQYLDELHARTLCYIERLSPDDWDRLSSFQWHGKTVLDTLLYNLRHVQHHVGQINLILSRKANLRSEWTGFVEPEPEPAP